MLLLTRDFRVCSVKDLLMNVGDQFSKDEVSLVTILHRRQLSFRFTQYLLM